MLFSLSHFCMSALYEISSVHRPFCHLFIVETVVVFVVTKRSSASSYRCIEAFVHFVIMCRLIVVKRSSFCGHKRSFVDVLLLESLNGFVGDPIKPLMARLDRNSLADEEPNATAERELD